MASLMLLMYVGSIYILSSIVICGGHMGNDSGLPYGLNKIINERRIVRLPVLWFCAILSIVDILVLVLLAIVCALIGIFIWMFDREIGYKEAFNSIWNVRLRALDEKGE